MDDRHQTKRRFWQRPGNLAKKRKPPSPLPAVEDEGLNIELMGSSYRVITWGHACSGVPPPNFGSFLTAAAFLAIGCLTSALTRNQVISFVIAVVICLLAILCGFPPVTDAVLDLEVAWININTLVDFIAGFSVVPHFQTMQRGVVDVRDVLYFLSVIVFSLFATGIVLRSKRSI